MAAANGDGPFDPTIPAFGPILGRLNGIIHLAENPCNEPWTVFARAALPWAGEPAMVLLGFTAIGPTEWSSMDPQQYLRNRLRSAAGRSSPHYRRNGRNGERGAIELPDQVSEQASIEPAKGTLIKPTMSTAETAFWEINGVVEHALWQWMIIDQASKFVYHSMADAHKSEYCRHWWGGDAYASGWFQPEPILGWQTVALLNDRYHHAPCEAGSGQPFCDNVGTMSVECAWSGTVAPLTEICYYGASLTATVPGGYQVLAEEEIRPYTGGETISFGFNGNFPTPGIAHFNIYASGGWTINSQANVMAMWNEGPRPGVPINPRTQYHHKHDLTHHHHYLRNQSVWAKNTPGGGRVYHIDPPGSGG